MNRARGGLGPTLTLAAVAAATTWVSMLSWRGFSVSYGRFLGPLLVLGIVIAGVGAFARWWRLPIAVVIGLQVVASGLVASAVLSGSPVPIGAAWGRLVESFSAALTSSQEYAAPVPAHVPGVHPLLIAGGLLCLLLVDVLACTLRRVPLAGLPLLTIYSIPISLVGGGVSWWVFTLTAAGFMGLLFLQESEQVARWGRPLGEDPAVADPSGFGVTTGAIRASAGTIGGVATALAVVLPLLIPTLNLHLFDFGRGNGDGNNISITNPMTDLKRDLVQGNDTPLLRFTTDDPHPDYLRISVLNRFSNNEWSSGDRDVPSTNLADGELPQLTGVSPTLNRTEHHYEVSVYQNFSSTWLPTMSPITSINAAGDWRYDGSTMDFIAGKDGLDTAGLNYSMTGAKLALSVDSLVNATASSGLVSKAYTETPPGMPSLVRTLANDVTQNAPSRFEKAVALQNWFRDKGGFTYDTRVASGNGTDELVSFLSETGDGRTGYCEQFSSAMAVMARMLGIPSRVAVGFLEPSRIGPKTWEYSAHDLHAWPELFFPGSGWVRFEPTPAGRAATVPSYTTQVVPAIDPVGPSGNPTASDELPSRGASASASPTKAAAASSRGDSGSSFPWLGLLGGFGTAALAALVLLLPRSLRRRRREGRLAGGPEEAWAELRATALDLGVPWPEGRSPRDTRRHLADHLGRPVEEGTAERPAHGAEVAPEAVSALDRVVRELELLRYARGSGDPGDVRADVETCLLALEGGASRSARRRAAWWPRSVVSGLRRVTATGTQRPVEARYGGVVDHVG